METRFFVRFSVPACAAFVVTATSVACGSARTPSDASTDAECKHEVVDKTATVTIDGAKACTYAQTYDSACGAHIPVSDCRTSCSDPNVTRCYLPGQVGPIMKLPDGGPGCEGWTNPTELKCETSHTVGTALCTQC